MSENKYTRFLSSFAFLRAEDQVSTNRNKVPDVVCMLEMEK